MTGPQLQTLHIARRKIEQLTHGVCDRAWFDLVLLNIGRVSADADGVISSKSLTNAGFERVMAFIEDETSKVDMDTGTYWRDRDRRRGHYLTTRQEWAVHDFYRQLVDAGSAYKLPGLVRNICGNRTDDLRMLNPSEAHKLIEMMKAALERYAANICVTMCNTSGAGGGAVG